MSWIYTGNNIWWKTLSSDYHPECIINQRNICNRCNKIYKNCFFEIWYTTYNYKMKKYDNKIYCSNCIIIKKRKRNIYLKLFNREISLKKNYLV